MKVIWIRHGKTQGNLKRQYIGSGTDEGLCDTGVNELQGKIYPPCQKVIASPMKRCLETAAIIYPNQPHEISDDLRECDFGDFEGKCYEELAGNADYQAWLDSGGMIPFPNGESQEQFRQRCCRAFGQVMAEMIPSSQDCIAFVVHGGTIMAVLEAYGIPKGTFYDYQVKNGCGYVTEYDGVNLRITGEIK